MRICVISTTVFPMVPPQGVSGYGGLEPLAWHQAEGLAKRGHEVLLVGADGTRCDHAQVFHTGLPMQHSEEQAYSKYWNILSSFDAVIDHSWQKWSYVLKQEGRLNAPILAVCHAPVDTMYRSLPNVPKPCMVCISEDQRTHLENLFLGVKGRTAYNGVDMDYYKPLDVPRSGRFLFLARFSSIKGPDLAIEACRKAGVGLDLVGDTKLTGEAEYLQYILHQADGKQIKFVGPASRGECVYWHSQAHCLLHPNQRFREPFGLSPVESMACGTPVIAWRYGAMAETVKDGETGWLADSLDEMVQKITEFKITDVVRNRCREWASQFGMDRFIRRYEELCQEAIDTGGW